VKLRWFEMGMTLSLERLEELVEKA